MNYGIDVSSYQKYIDFAEVRSNYSFVILRAGFTGYGGDGTSKYLDSSFEDFYVKAKNAGLNVGVYYYSCANTYEKGQEEAKFLYEHALKGKKFEYPIYMDVEENRHQLVGKERMRDAIKGFCDYLENLGYYVGVYANSNYFYNHIDTAGLKDYDKWLAVWNKNRPNFKYGYGMWQNSNSGRVGNYRVDTNIAFRDYPSIIMSNHFNGYTEVTSPSQNTSDVVSRVLKGEFGNGEARKVNLENAGYNYMEVQNSINNLYAKKPITITNTSQSTYVVKSGDSLWAISKRLLGNGNRYMEIAKKNNLANPSRIYPGQVLII